MTHPKADADVYVVNNEAQADEKVFIINGDVVNTTTPADGDFVVRRSGLWVPDTIKDSDIPASIARDSEVTAAVATETTRATAAESTNATAISTNATAISTETTRATTAEGLLVPKSLIDAKGDIFVGTADNTVARHAAGNDGEVPVWDSAATDGVRNSVLVDPRTFNGLLGWTHDPGLLPSGGAGNLNATILNIGKIPLRRSISVTSVIAYLGTVGVSLTHCYALLYNSSGTVIGQSQDYAANWVAAGSTLDGNAGGVGLKTMPLQSGPFTAAPLQANDFLWAALYCGTAGTAPQFWKNVAVAAALFNVGLTAATCRGGTVTIANTATPGNITPANNALASNCPWMAIN